MGDLFLTPDAIMTCRVFGPVLLQSTADKTITESDWQAYVDFIRSLHEAKRLPSLGIQYSLTQAPSTSQRKRVGEVMGDMAFSKFALISASALVRGAVTAITWLTRSRTEVRAFSPDEVRQSLVWLASHEHFDVDEALRLLREDAQKIGCKPIR